MKYKLLIFDWDGTLVNSSKHIVSSIEHACATTGETFPGREAAENIIGLGMHEAISALFGPRKDDFVEAFRQAYSTYFFARQAHRRDLFPGVMELLELLRSQGFRLAIATGKSRRGMDLALNAMQLGPYFDHVRCADETRSKPDPKMLLELLDAFSLTAEEAIMIGDTEYDMDMAKRINMTKIAVSYGVHNIDRMRAFHLAGIANKPLQLLDLIDKLGG